MIDYCIEMKDVCFGYQKQLLFEGLNLNFQPAQSVGIIGANGAGKSTLLKLLIGLLPANSGTITINGLKLDNDNLKAIRSQISYLFQDSESQLFCSNVYDEIAFGPRNYGHSEEETRNLVEQALKAIHIEHLRDKSTYQLSGGEKKLVINNPKPGKWYVSVYCDTTVDTRQTDYGTQYSGCLEVLNGVPYSIQADF